MPRIARVVAVGLPHHITQRGNDRCRVFFSRADRQAYLDLIRKCSEKHKASILAYCLMDNHVHFIVIPGNEDSLARTFNAAHMSYAQRIHGNRKSSGHLWQGRFFSCVLDNHHLLAAARYVECNPVRAHSVRQPWDWEWSSAAHHTGEAPSQLPLAGLFELTGMSQEKWKEYIANNDAGFANRIRKNTLTGRPLGTDAFIEKLERQLGRKLTARSVGRPKIGRCP